MLKNYLLKQSNEISFFFQWIIMDGDSSGKDSEDALEVLLPSDEEDSEETATPPPNLTIGQVLDILPRAKNGNIIS